MNPDYHDTQSQLAVRPGDLDSVGHVNNARVLEYLEHGRWDWLRSNGLSRQGGVVPVVASVEVHYLAEIAWGPLNVCTHFASDDEAVYKARFEQTVATDTAQPAAKAVVHVAFIDAHTRRLCTIEDFLDTARMPSSAAEAPAT